VKLVIFNFGGQVSIACVFPGMLLVQGIWSALRWLKFFSVI
jgi:hypothetical protein